MDFHKVSYLALLLLFGMISHVEHADAKPCFKNCDTRLAYEICPRPQTSNKVDFNRICVNCCLGKKGCSFFGPDGSFICKGESDPQNPKPCTLNCDPRIAYGICPVSENKKPKVDFNRICINCCSGKKGCSYFGPDGSFICKGESDPQNPKPCTLNCDPRIVYGICPLSENKKPKVEKLCTNCCAGKKGCYYYNADGEFICEGESEYDSQKIMSVVS